MGDATALRDEATELLRELLRIDTSNPPGGETPAALVLRDHLEGAGLEVELVARDPARANVVARLPGTGDGPSLMLLGHTDVVPAEAGDWRHPPFGGHLDDDGYVWGRGAIDMKNEVATRAVAVAELARSGFRPRGDLLFVAVADEEDGSADVGMKWLVRERPDLAPDYVVNEGAGERLELADGRTVVTITVGERGCQGVRLTALGEAGHSSLPRPEVGAVPRLARLIGRLDSYRPSRRVVPETAELLRQLVGWTDGEDLDAAIARALPLHPAIPELVDPLFSTTIAPTRLHGSSALNVLPARASVDCDCRLVPGTTEEELRAELTAALGDDLPYELEPLEVVEGGSVSSVETPLFDACRAALAELEPDALLLPTLCNGFTDSHYARDTWGAVAYGIWPVLTTPYSVAADGVHAADERVHVDDLGAAVGFHVSLTRRLLG